MFASNGGNTTLVVKALTSTMPIIFLSAGDPVQLGLVASLNRPGGNITGINSESGAVERKQLGLLHELLPQASRFALLWSRAAARPSTVIPDLRAAAQSIGVEIEVFYAGTNAEIDSAFADLVQKRTDALIVQSELLFRDRRTQILTLAARHALPVIFGRRADAEAGGLMSYGPSIEYTQRQFGIHTGRILKGEKPADLPIVLSTRFEFLINVQTAKTLGIEVPGDGMFVTLAIYS